MMIYYYNDFRTWNKFHIFTLSLTDRVWRNFGVNNDGRISKVSRKFTTGTMMKEHLIVLNHILTKTQLTDFSLQSDEDN